MAKPGERVDFPQHRIDELKGTINKAAIATVDHLTVDRFQARMRELRDMGFEDIPWTPGVRSSMRVYAEGTLIFDDARAEGKIKDNEPEVFVTRDKALLERADELEKRFRLRPITPDEMADIRHKLGEDANVVVSEKTVNDVSAEIARDACRAMGIDPEKIPSGMFDQMVARVKTKMTEGMKYGSPGKSG